MPELAEVETLKRYLEKHIIGERIQESYRRRNNLRFELNSHLEEQIDGASIIQLKRRAKFLNIYLSNHNILTYHLGMSGRLIIEDSYEEKKHDHFIINFSSGRHLVFNDPRRFGMIYVCNEKDLNSQSFLKNMGPEPLSDEFDANYLHAKLKNKKAAIKTVIMDSKTVVGVGNIYAAESLFMSSIHPEAAANTLTKKQVSLLAESIKLVLSRAIEAGGTTLKDFVSGDSSPGYFKQQLNVYDRENKNCHKCEHVIERIKQTGRSTFFCPNCQKI